MRNLGAGVCCLLLMLRCCSFLFCWCRRFCRVCFRFAAGAGVFGCCFSVFGFPFGCCFVGCSVVPLLLEGPNWDVKLGRRDSKTASLSAANSGVIPPPTSTLQNLINRFKARGLSAKDMVALSGSHTIGQARCTIFRNRIYNESNIDSSFAKKRQANCPRNSGDNNLAPLDFQTPTAFDNNYYKNLLNQKGLLHSDQVLFNGDSTDSLVKTYGSNSKIFNSDFASAMIKMGDISPLTGSSGEIRKNCRKPN